VPRLVLRLCSPHSHQRLPSSALLTVALLQVIYSSVPSSQLFYALNGAVVGLCGAAATTQQPAGAAAGAGAGAAPAPPAALPCLGLGIVRAADAARRRLHILTAVPPEELEGVATLQLGKLELPASLLHTAAARVGCETGSCSRVGGSAAGALPPMGGRPIPISCAHLVHAVNGQEADGCRQARGAAW
jgi:hypothetical protein